MAVKILRPDRIARRASATVALAAGLVLTLAPGSASAADSRQPVPPPEPRVTYADLADLADSAPLVLRAQVRRMRPLEPERAVGVKPGMGRFYIEARTRALIAGPGFGGGDLRYLVDLPLDARGKPPKLGKTDVFLFARAVAGRPGEIQLVAPDAQVTWGPQAEARLRAILTEMAETGKPAIVTGIREAIHVPGALAGEGETQLFLSTRDDTAAAITISRSADRAATWTWSFSEVASAGTAPPQPETLAWYRLACFLPPALPGSAELSERPQDRAQAQADYSLVRQQLGPCERLRR